MKSGLLDCWEGDGGRMEDTCGVCEGGRVHTGRVPELLYYDSWCTCWSYRQYED